MKPAPNLNGEVTIEHEGKTYILVLDLNAMCVLEDMFDTHMLAIIAEMQKPSARHMRAFLWATLQAHQPEATLEDAGKLSRGPNGLKGIGTIIAALTKTMTADKQDLEALGVTEGGRPPQAATRTAAASRPRSKPTTGAASTSKSAGPAG